MGDCLSKLSRADLDSSQQLSGAADGAGGAAKPTEPVVGSEPPSVDLEEFTAIEELIKTGDLAVLYREGQTFPHFAVFIQHPQDDPDFPLLLVKGKTKPLPREKFNPALGREAHTTTAVNRIFYGDYKTVLVRHLQTNEEFPIDKVMENVQKVQKLPFSESELEVIDKATTPEARSALLSALMIAQFYKLMPVSGGPIFDRDPSKVTPQTLAEGLKLSPPRSIKLPPTKPGPLVTGDPPLLHAIL